MTDQFSAHDMATAAADGFRAGHLNGTGAGGQGMTFPYDVARCDGRITDDRYGQITTHSECVRCRRREPGHPDHQMYMPVPALVAGKCPMRIEP